MGGVMVWESDRRIREPENSSVSLPRKLFGDRLLNTKDSLFLFLSFSSIYFSYAPGPTEACDILLSLKRLAFPQLLLLFTPDEFTW